MTARRLATICTMFASLSGAAVAQSAPRTVQLSPSLPNDPVKIVKVMLDSVEVKPTVQAWPANKPGVPFQAGDDWFDHLTVVLKNISSKQIIFGVIQSSFPEIGEGTRAHPTVGDHSEVGNLPEHGMYSGLTGKRFEDEPQRDPILVQPGQEFTVPVIAREHSNGVRETIESRRSISSTTTIVIWIGSFYFEDGTKWAANLYYRPNFSAPGKYTVISREEFDAYRREAQQ